VSVERIKAEGLSPFTYPVKNAVKYEFAARGNMPALTLYWEDCVQDGGWIPPGMTAEERARSPARVRRSRPRAAVVDRKAPAGQAGQVLRVDRALQVDREVSAADGRHSTRHRLQLHHEWDQGPSRHIGSDRRRRPASGIRWAEYKLPTPTYSLAGREFPRGVRIHGVHLKTGCEPARRRSPGLFEFQRCGAVYRNGWCWQWPATMKEVAMDNAKMEFRIIKTRRNGSNPFIAKAGK